jgi:Flp pilus assembly protein TadD
MRTLRLLSVLFACCSAAPTAAPAPSAPHWLEVHTPHFTVVTNSSEKDARHVAAQFERMRAVFKVLMPNSTDDPAAPIVVLALKDRASFRALEPEAYLSRSSLDLAGLFLRSQDKNYVLLRLDASGEHPYSTVYHEYTHYMLRRGEDWIPLWLNEGLAEFYQNTTLDPKEVRVGKPSVDDILYLRDNRLLPLVTLLTVDHTSPYYHDEQKGSVFYAESWALTHYLEVNDYEHKTNHLGDYERLLQQHKDPLTAAAQAFGDLKQLELALDAYIRGADFKEFRLNTPVNFTEDSFEVQPLPTPQADAIRADVLVGDDRAKDAEALIQSVLQADPSNALAHETMGSLKFRQNDIPAALDWYSQAVQLDSHSYLAHYYFAVFTMQSGDRSHDDAIEQSLRTSIELNPRFAPSYDALAHFYAVRHEKFDEAHMLNLKAVSLEPESIAFRQNDAEVLAQSGKIDAALSVLKATLLLAKTPGETQMLNQRIAQLEHYQAEEAYAEGAMKRRSADPATSSAVTTSTESTVTVDSSGRRTIRIAPTAAGDEPPYPGGPATGPHHTVSGVIPAVKCSYPAILTLTLEPTGKNPAKPVNLYTNNFYKITFYAPGSDPNVEILPCTGIDGKKASIDFGEVTDPRVAGQILTITLIK